MEILLVDEVKKPLKTPFRVTKPVRQLGQSSPINYEIKNEYLGVQELSKILGVLAPKVTDTVLHSLSLTPYQKTLLDSKSTESFCYPTEKVSGCEELLILLDWTPTPDEEGNKSLYWGQINIEGEPSGLGIRVDTNSDRHYGLWRKQNNQVELDRTKPFLTLFGHGGVQIKTNIAEHRKWRPKINLKAPDDNVPLEYESDSSNHGYGWSNTESDSSISEIMRSTE